MHHNNLRFHGFLICLFYLLFLNTSTAKAEIDIDLYFSKQAIGTWKYNEGFSHGETTYFADGTFEGKGIINLPDNKLPMFVKGTWMIDDGYFIETIVETDLPEEFLPYNNEFIDKVESITKDKMITIDEEGERCVYTKKLPPEQEKKHLQLVNEYFKAVKIKEFSNKLLKDEKEKIFENLKKDNAIPQDAKLELEKFLRETREIVEKYMRWENVKQSYLSIYSDIYSDEELKALIKFYHTPLGRKVRDNMIELSQKTMVLVEDQNLFATAELAKYITDYINEKIQEESEKEERKGDGA
jgi:uncharacterized protein